MARYVALLRGINVGGNNLIRMADLKDCFVQQGLSDVATYIASGNVLFSTPESSRARLTAQLEKALSQAFNYRASVVIRSRPQLADVVARAPEGFGAQPAKYRYDAIFLMEPLKSTAALKTVPMNPGVDAVSAGPGVLYFSRRISKATRSHLPRLIAMPLYQRVTIRNWNTTTKLLALMQEA